MRYLCHGVLMEVASLIIQFQDFLYVQMEKNGIKTITNGKTNHAYLKQVILSFLIVTAMAMFNMSESLKK